jgi:hypothetical protein
MSSEPEKFDPVTQAALAAIASAQKSLEDARKESKKSAQRWKVALGLILLGMIPL